MRKRVAFIWFDEHVLRFDLHEHIFLLGLGLTAQIHRRNNRLIILKALPRRAPTGQHHSIPRSPNLLATFTSVLTLQIVVSWYHII